jgi:hypothetical protein
MATLPVFCGNCGAVWGARNIIGGSGARGITLSNATAGPCPNCGGTGRVPDGVYDLMDDTLAVVQSAALPKTTLQALIDLLESLNRGEATADEVMEKVRDEAPDLAPTVNVYLQKTDRAGWIAVLIAILALLMQTPGTVNDVSELLHKNPAVPPVATERGASATGQTATAKPKRKRPPKTVGKSKKRRPRSKRRR